MAWFANPVDPAWRCAPPNPAVRAFHRSLPGYAPTELVELPRLAAEAGVGRVFAKFEADRFGLPAFKGLGASWALQQALAGQPAESLVVAATDGNHGRAVAHFARLAGCQAVIVIPSGVGQPAIAAIRDEDADVREIDGDYDAAVLVAADIAASQCGILVQDTAWEGYEQIPAWIVEGYETLFAELDEQGVPPDLVVVPAGVGSITQAAVCHYRSGSLRPAILNVEPTSAACVLASLERGERTSVQTSTTVMAGLNCNSVSTIAWPLLHHGVDAAVAVTDDQARTAMHDLAGLGIDAGICGAASLAGLRAAALPDRRQHLRLTADSVVVLLITERRLPGFLA